MLKYILALSLISCHPDASNPNPELWQRIQATKIHPTQNTSDRNDVIQLGSQLFFDKRLSKNGNVACATCHQPEKSFTDGKPLAFGIAATAFNTPTLTNLHLARWFFWDGRSDNLVSQALQPLFHPNEQGLNKLVLYDVIKTHYRDLYEKLYGPLPRIGILIRQNLSKLKIEHSILRSMITTLNAPDEFSQLLQMSQNTDVSIEQLFVANYLNEPGATEWSNQTLDQIVFNVASAIAAFEKTILAQNSPFDRFAREWQKWQSPHYAFNEGFGRSEYQGLQIFFGKGNCHNCHFGPRFSDEEFHNIGLPRSGKLLIGRAIGIAKNLHNQDNCTHPYFDASDIRNSYGCQVKPFLKTTLETIGAFKTPTLRNLADTAPYFHNGSANTLNDVIDHYNSLSGNPAIGHREESLKPLGLSEMEKHQLISFLGSLNSPITYASGVEDANFND